MKTAPPPTTHWMSVRQAAGIIGFNTVSLRRVLERNSRRAPDGAVEASIDGLRARKLGRSWRVQLSDSWTQTTPSRVSDRGAT